MKRAFLCSLLLAVIMLMPIILASGEEDDAQQYPQIFQHGPILFDGSVYNGTPPDGITGSGTESDPFVITGHWINITDSPGIAIINSSHHFRIHTNLFTNAIPFQHPGISIRNSSNILIDLVYAYYCSRGVEVLNSSDIRIEGSGLFGCYDGLYTQGKRIVIENCLFKVNVENGILINRSSDVNVNNVISDGNTAILGVTSGIHVIDSDDVRISNTTCSLNYGYGILVEPSDPTIVMERIGIFDSYIDSNNNGLVIKNVLSGSVENTLMQHNTNGLYISTSRSFDVLGCSFYKNTYGAFLSYSDDLLIDDSDFDRNENGIYLDSTHNSTILHCMMTNGTWHAITVDTWLGLGPSSSNNSIYGNEFRDNGPVGSQVMDNGEDNSWYGSLVGNTWHDHWGPDADNDAIVDEPYEIDGLADASDIYPRAIDKGEIIVDDPEPEDEDPERDRMTFWIILGITGAIVGSLTIWILVRKEQE